jgi:hypothetical protein
MAKSNPVKDYGMSSPAVQNTGGTSAANRSEAQTSNDSDKRSQAPGNASESLRSDTVKSVLATTVHTLLDRTYRVAIIKADGGRLIALPAVLGGVVGVAMTAFYPQVLALAAVAVLFSGIRLELERDQENASHGAASKDEVDESSDESFPASDPPAWTPVTGTGTPEADVKDDKKPE